MHLSNELIIQQFSSVRCVCAFREHLTLAQHLRSFVVCMVTFTSTNYSFVLKLKVKKGCHVICPVAG